MRVFYNGYQIFNILHSLKLQCHYICHFMPFLVDMPFSREGTKGVVKLLLLFSVKIHHIASFALWQSQSSTKKHFFLEGDTSIEVRRTSFSSQNKTIDENKAMISLDHFYIVSLKLLFLGIFINSVCLSPFLIFLFFAMKHFETDFLTFVLLSPTKQKGGAHI